MRTSFLAQRYREEKRIKFGRYRDRNNPVFSFQSLVDTFSGSYSIDFLFGLILVEYAFTCYILNVKIRCENA